ncbi:MAG: SET domain-containing protein-lysine N-methyltransferase [Alphaproteobacteria bacterium]
MSSAVEPPEDGPRAVSLTMWDLVEVRPNGASEHGLYARDDIPRGVVLGCFDGRAKLFNVGADGRLETDAHTFKDLVQLRRVGGTVLALAPVDGFEGIDFANHSCTPNANLRQGVVMVARRRIRAGEEITLDYRKLDVVIEGIECWCDVENRCRI